MPRRNSGNRGLFVVSLVCAALALAIPVFFSLRPANDRMITNTMVTLADAKDAFFRHLFSLAGTLTMNTVVVVCLLILVAFAVTLRLRRGDYHSSVS